MEKVAEEELHLLGPFRILREAFSVLLRSSRSKVLWPLALHLFLLVTFASLGQNFILGPILLKIQQKRLEAAIHPGETTWRELGSECRELVGVPAADIAVVLTSWMLSTAAGMYTAASIYSTNTKELKVSYVRYLSNDFPRVWKRLMLTFKWFFVLSFGFMTVSVLASGLLLILFLPTIPSPSVGLDAEDKLKGRAVIINVILPLLFVACSQIYITVVWHLASVVSVLEDKYYGLGALLKSSNIIKGKRITALALLIFFFMFDGIIVWFFGYTVAEGRSHGLRTATRAVIGALLLGLHCFVNVMWMLAQSVLYFVCKSYHHESIDGDSSFKVHNVEDYEALKRSSI